MGVCRRVNNDWMELGIEADWRYLKALEDIAHPHAELSEYFVTGLMGGSSVEGWTKHGEARKPEKILDERTHKGYDQLELRS